MIPEESINGTVAICLSIDSGTGALKLMMKFLTEKWSQKTRDAFLIAEVQGMKETCNGTESCSGHLTVEIETLVT